MPEKTVIIVGAGLGGLATGCYAQMNGYRSHIFEQHRVPGGLACSWKRKEYLIDGGIHFLTGYRPGYRIHDIFREIGVNSIPYVDLSLYGRFTSEERGLSVDIHRDLPRLQQELMELFPEDEKTIKELISAARVMSEKDLQDVGFSRPAELMGLVDWARELWRLKGIWRFMLGKWNKPIRDYAEKIHDPSLKEIVLNLFLPEMPVWFVTMILGSLVAGQIGLVRDGALEFARAIEKRFLELGGEVDYRTDVKEIVVEDNRAVGVRLADKREYRSDYVVSAADGYHTIFELLKGRYVNEEIKRRYLGIKRSFPMVAVSFGVSREFKEEPWMTIMKMEKPIAVGSKSEKLATFRVLNYGPKFAPPGKSVFQVGFETDWGFWNDLRKDQDKYDAEKDRIAIDVLKLLDRHYPGFSSDVEVTDVVTPWTYYKYTRNLEGSIMGILPESLYGQVKKALPGLSNFWLAGQWSMPMGGVISAIFSGRHVLQLICRQDKKKFTTTFS